MSDRRGTPPVVSYQQSFVRMAVVVSVVSGAGLVAWLLSNGGSPHRVSQRVHPRRTPVTIEGNGYTLTMKYAQPGFVSIENWPDSTKPAYPVVTTNFPVANIGLAIGVSSITCGTRTVPTHDVNGSYMENPWQGKQDNCDVTTLQAEQVAPGQQLDVLLYTNKGTIDPSKFWMAVDGHVVYGDQTLRSETKILG